VRRPRLRCPLSTAIGILVSGEIGFAVCVDEELDGLCADIMRRRGGGAWDGGRAEEEEAHGMGACRR